MITQTVAVTGSENPALHPRHIAAVVVGNALEFYDFLTYAFFAVYIGKTFFPSVSPFSSLLLSLATFGAGFITRPIGGLVIGAMGDRIGRRPALFLSFSLMGAAMLGMVFTPSYAAIGGAAPVLMLLFRLLQGFALGGEFGPATAFLIEACPREQRGFYGSLQSATQYLAVLASGLVGTALAAWLAPPALEAWGWRIAMLLGALIVPFGLFIRRELPETLEDLGNEESRGAAIMPHPPWRVVTLALLMLASATICTYVLLYISTYAIVTLQMGPHWAFAATAVIGVCGIVCVPIGGAVSDRVGRKPVMIASAAGLLVATVPGFLAISAWRTGPALLVVVGALSVLLAMGVPVVIVAITESLPRPVRSGALATIYALAISIFGGTTQFGVAWLTEITGDVIAPAYYMSASLAVGLVAMILMRESAPLRRRW